jgi:hypothetical protein
MAGVYSPLPTRASGPGPDLPVFCTDNSGSIADVRRRTRPIPTSPALLVATTLLGTWTAHNLEYLRIWGPGLFSGALSRSAHTYLGPVGAALVVLAAVAVYGSVRLAERLERRLVELQRALRSGKGGSGPAPDAAAGWELHFHTLLAVLWTVQLALYLAQENLEARAIGLRAPGLGAVSGVHAFAALVHLGVAAAGATLIWLLRRPVTRLSVRVASAEALLAVRRHRRPVTRAAPTSTRSRTPLDLWGPQLWARPPPVAA